MISHVETMVKIWESFAHFVTYDVYKSKHLKERLVALRMIQLDFETTVIVKLWFDCKTFCMDNREYMLFHVKFW